MGFWAWFGLGWLAVSIVAAPIVGRMIHDPAGCPECARKRDIT